MYTSPTENEGIRDGGSRIPNRENILPRSISRYLYSIIIYIYMQESRIGVDEP